MGHPDIDYMVVMERRRDELAQAAHARLVKEALMAKQNHASQPEVSRLNHLSKALLLFFAHFLSLAGERMLNWSCQLQYRYTMLAASAPEKQPSPCDS